METNAGTNWEMIIAVIALLVGLLDLVLHIIQAKKENISLSVFQEGEGRSIGFVWYKNYLCTYAYIRIENKSLTPVTISEISLIGVDGEAYAASPYDMSDTYTSDGLTLVDKNDSNKMYSVFLGRENILSKARISSNDSISGYVVFFDTPLVEQEEHLTLLVKTPNKTYKIKALITKLPSNLRPLNELKEQ